ncbi:TetR/AcrR family transcriptional regulator [Streptomyces tsukubensis]|uniref:TetR/AcrR family transcriptional regulator n=1 Tax=Streptomyces tsukubensis TaxID=83656 RepID=UPI0026C26042
MDTSGGAAEGGGPPDGGAKGGPGGRARDASATRARLLDAAATLFAERGYERATVRDIAARAGANQALIFRYFGSKRALLTEVMARDGQKQLRGTQPEHVFETALRGILSDGGGGGVGGGGGGGERGPGPGRSLEVYLRSIGSADSAPETVRALGDEYVTALAALSTSDDGVLRAELAMAWLLGIGLMRVVIKKEPLVNADPEEVCGLVLRVLERLFDEPQAAAEGAAAERTRQGRAPRPRVTSDE